ncbi:concanavalin A-like lectin/glucanase domain-containing protein [Rhizophagus irregularis DAOM 181602=DAOM 197198]|nr:concanavalin A-like lectin/glucanase domain-containing protein [Rhizophagus irregularis DAOM 181602=DAOM 197198]
MRIDGQILVEIIEPLGIIPAKIILFVYRKKVRLTKSELNNTRGIPIPIYSKYVWDELERGSNVLIKENGKIVCLKSATDSWRNVRAKMILEGKGIFEWDFIMEKACVNAWVGVCAPENLSYEFFAGKQLTGWVLGTNGYCYNSNKGSSYCPPFGDGSRITVHLDMNKRTCSFIVNGTKYPEVSAWNNLPSKLYPVASFNYPARLRIQPHQKSV